MCTVTFIPDNEKVFLTSNRDEKSRRSIAVPPQSYTFNSGKIFFPKDRNAGGTWFAVHENGTVLVLLNGGFKFHKSAPPYRKSRGLILVELIEHETPFNFFRSISLEDIEPFTLVIWENENLFECRWDGEKKYAKHLDKTMPHIWSSATLYDDKVSAKRKSWFEEWLINRTAFTQNDILHFHQFTGDGDKHNDLTMNRHGKVFTVSITGVEISETKAAITYLDLLNNKTYLQPIELNKEWAER
jgi:Transport and Golgi organisation 2